MTNGIVKATREELLGEYAQARKYDQAHGFTGYRALNAATGDGKDILWIAFCCTCGKVLDSMANGNMCEAVGGMHLKAHKPEKHIVMIGYQILLNEEV